MDLSLPAKALSSEAQKQQGPTPDLCVKQALCHRHSGREEKDSPFSLGTAQNPSGHSQVWKPLVRGQHAHSTVSESKKLGVSKRGQCHLLLGPQNVEHRSRHTDKTRIYRGLRSCNLGGPLEIYVKL